MRKKATALFMAVLMTVSSVDMSVLAASEADFEIAADMGGYAAEVEKPLPKMRTALVKVRARTWTVAVLVSIQEQGILIRGRKSPVKTTRRPETIPARKEIMKKECLLAQKIRGLRRQERRTVKEHPETVQQMRRHRETA